ncbi:toll-like receptor 4 [Mya arenaria]|uniref:toll-like receptor 4 n=1 Tax=Mya arenaria TaxID=6604 RepID=UPI0022E4BA79|nr:toll-like receptor 4 [Mya arenaria]
MGFHYGYFVWTLLIVVVNARNEVVEEHAGPSTDCSKSTRNAFNPAAALNGSKCSIEKTGCGKQLACDGKMFDSIPLEYPDISNPICSLNLSNNLISDIPNKAFNLTSLKLEYILYLYLDANIIQFICPEGFYGLTNLQFLNLSANKLTWPDSFMNGIFAPMVRLESLNLQGSKFSTFKGFGKEMKMLNNLRSLSMSPSSKGGDLFFEKEFLELKNLVNISFYDMLGECNIYNIRDNAFENVPYVKVLNLDNCHIRTISRHALKPLNSSLQVLSISQNKNLQFSGMNDALAGLENSSALITLRANAIHKFNGLGIAVKEDDIQYIQTFKAIEHLHLDLNKIEVLEKQILYPTYMLPGSLRAVTLAGNRLVGGGYILYLYKATNITFVDISGQYLNLRPFLHFGTQAGVQTSSLFDGIKSFIGDTTLTVNVNEIYDKMFYSKMSSSDWVDNYEKGVFNFTLNCNCKTTNVEKFLCLPPDIEICKFSNSHAYTKIYPMIVCDTTKLTSLDLSGNLLYMWEGPVLGLQHLKRLDLSNNYCTYIHDVFFIGFTDLEDLNISKNSLTENFDPASDKYNADKLFQNLKNLRNLDMSEVRIYFLDRCVFQNLIKLERLWLDQNYLNVWSADLMTVSLQLLSFAGNKFTFLPENLTSYLNAQVTKHNVTLNMSYMSLECSCEQLPFWKWLSTTKVHKVVEANRCMLNGKPQRVEYPTDFLKVVNTLEHVECIDRRWITWAISGSSALVAVLLTLIISTIVYRNRWKLRYVYYSRKRRYVHTGFDRLFSNDAMISYSKGKASFIKSSVVPSLEHNHDLSLWIHDRDSAAGESVAENITHAICTSRKTVLFIDNEYLTDSWCGYDMNIALVESVETQRKLIIVLLMDGLNADRLPIHILRLLRDEILLEYPESENGNALETLWNELAIEIRK